MKAITSEGEGEVELFLALELLQRILETDGMLGFLHALAGPGDALAERHARGLALLVCLRRKHLFRVHDDVG